MSNVRIERINSELKKQITAVIAHELKDPRIGKCIVGVTGVNTTPDLSYAKVSLSVIASDESERRAAFDTVVRGGGFIRNRLKTMVELRHIPELIFELDTSVDYGMKIDALLSIIDIPPAED